MGAAGGLSSSLFDVGPTLRRTLGNSGGTHRSFTTFQPSGRDVPLRRTPALITRLGLSTRSVSPVSPTTGRGV